MYIASIILYLPASDVYIHPTLSLGSSNVTVHLRSKLLLAAHAAPSSSIRCTGEGPREKLGRLGLTSGLP
jgi:hypothetical protein